MARELRYRLLGPLKVECAEEQIRLTGSRQRVLLAMLLLEANQVMSIDRLIAAVWSEDPPVSAKSQIRICVSELRRKFAAKGCGEVIETHSSGYLLRVDEGALDLHRFQDLVERGRAAAANGRLVEAVRLLRSALDLWRGRLAVGLESDLLAAAAVKVTEDRYVVVEEYIDLNLRLGRQREIIGELNCYVADAPFRENLCAQLMLALHLSGRRAEALEFYRTVRKRFADELGIEPGESLRKTEIFVLTNESGTLPTGHRLRLGAHPATDRIVPDTRAETEHRLTRLESEIVRLRAEYHAFVAAAKTPDTSPIGRQ
ncbi:AfsR/SARP family transcriptional regulator [Nocardia iowensis]|uniref:AfsR/SARP family transcriptional regulator n=1 Tax=Nocardia iowensis TaxID=204891 RepID=A0ABX8RJ88_NOCIO|nr:AfsR/SARP family transcriptional regulator [Nocardia iowensis]QXN89391.1 AfsR/SARP family transcriptional regulator [Nocardia iowensis]